MAAGTTEETLGPLLNVLAQSLDVQEVFARISALARQMVPHDCLVFGLVAEDGERYCVVAVSEDAERDALLDTCFAPPSTALAQEDFAIFHHLRTLPGQPAALEVRGSNAPVGGSKLWRAVLGQATKVANAETTVLLAGESGTGKEVVAHLIHRGSRRADGPFVALNCAALPEALLESELFGYEKGAFTGAVSARAGRLEQAAGGTLFLDEVGEMSPAVQAKFLRVLEEREFQRLGGTRLRKADVRVIAATNPNLQGALTAGTFREDLYYRLYVFAIHLPPLRERREDILPLLEHFVATLGPVVLGRPPAGISREARAHLLAYGWPGDLRGLKNAAGLAPTF